MLTRREVLRALSLSAGALAIPGAAGCGAHGQRVVASQRRPEDVHAQLAELVTTLSRHGHASARMIVRRGSIATVDIGEQAVSGHDDAGVVLAIADGHRLREAATSDISADGLAALARSLVTGPSPAPATAPARAPRSFTLPAQDVSHEPKNWLARAAELARRAASAGDSRIIYWRARAGFVDTDTFHVDPRVQLRQRIVRSAAEASLLAWSGRWAAAESAQHGTTAGLAATTLPASAIAGAAERVLGLVYGRPPPAGMHAVILAPQVAATLLLSCVAPALRANFLAAEAAPRVGQKFGSDKVTIGDDPTLAGGFGSYAFDDTGHMARKTQLIEDGVVTALLGDGHRRRPAPMAAAAIAPSNLLWAPGTLSPSQVIAAVDAGIVVSGTAGAWLDPATGRVTLRASLGHRIVSGRLSGEVYRDLTLTGHLRAILGQVTAVSTAPAPGTARLSITDRVPAATAIAPHVATRMEVL
ncbi:MAG TPA: metallopeptidase TldD-related protein [Kofleriaceae bacterium]|nr:metallopeptidase TldD-related protein [Kofleriaceae bacterium]